MGAYERVPCREIIDTARHSQTPRRCFERAEAKSTRARKTHTPSSRLLPWYELCTGGTKEYYVIREGPQ
ncbi:hypothetical protein V495_04330 [Pseudogymnoascus sp. VKM F-4514 (FW-929)]|nr:hypothetical protein V495_04330 [Pseudogymnoascus sp. VKM F-4514 (FW-929)]